MSKAATRVLLVDDDGLMVHLIERFLVEDGFDVRSAATGEEGLALVRSGDFDVMLLDVDLPGMSGVEVLTRMRREGSRVPVLMVSGDSDKRHIAHSLDEGADDYVPKPVDPTELPARIRAVLRRHHQTAPAVPPRILVHQDISFDEARRNLAGPEGDISLTATEAALLRELIRGAGRLLAGEELQERIWGIDFDPGTNVVAVHVSRLRSKLARVGSSIVVKSKRGAGYQIVE